MACQCYIISINLKHKEKKFQKSCALTSNQTGEDSGNTPGRLVSILFPVFVFASVNPFYYLLHNYKTRKSIYSVAFEILEQRFCGGGSSEYAPLFRFFGSRFNYRAAKMRKNVFVRAEVLATQTNSKS